MLNFVAQYEAFQRRDPRLDGVFFVAVKTTGIYCRPVCKVRTPLVAQRQVLSKCGSRGMCRFSSLFPLSPEAAPFCPAWKGTKTTVERALALALIETGALERDTVDALAAKLGIGPRHLSRLFAEHLDASPLQVAQSLRIQRAKRLLDSTDLPISLIAERAGFSGPRRMSAAFARLYGRPATTDGCMETKSAVGVHYPRHLMPRVAGLSFPF
jgi:AraC family transcriptional regulator of adaptative response/methylated-DNA-[protein]-cysteine methyltransferase